MKRHYFVALLATMLLAACGSEEQSQEQITLTGGTSTEQTVYADETGVKEGIKFTATASWTAVVEDISDSRAGGNVVDWLTLNMYSGEAGDYTLTMTLQENLTGKGRKARISIRSGSTVISIVVEQKGTKSDGTVIKAIRKIVLTANNNADKELGYTNADVDNYEKTFSYDEQGRVTRIVTLWTGYGNKTYTESFDYQTAGQITVKTQGSSYGTGVEEENTYTVKLNAAGNAASIADEEGEFMRFSYTSDGRFAQWKDTDAGDESCQANYVYENGMLSKYEYISSAYPEENITYTFNTTSDYSHRYPNNCPADIFGLIAWDNDYDFLFLIGRAGKTTDYLFESFPIETDQADAAQDTEFHTPGVTIHKSYKYVEWQTPATLGYTYDTDNCLTSVTVRLPYRLMQKDYDVVVSDDPVVPDHPEYNGYKFETKNHVTTKVKDDFNIQKYEISY